MAQLVHDFETGSMDQKDLLGGKGANLAEMTRLGIPVPPGFTISTAAWTISASKPSVNAWNQDGRCWLAK